MISIFRTCKSREIARVPGRKDRLLDFAVQFVSLQVVAEPSGNLRVELLCAVRSLLACKVASTNEANRKRAARAGRSSV
eukprot:8069657-Lingulodinium_polyedra.AAC.1